MAFNFDKISFRPTAHHKQYLEELSRRSTANNPTDLMKNILDNCILNDLSGHDSENNSAIHSLRDNQRLLPVRQGFRETNHADVYDRRRVDSYSGDTFQPMDTFRRRREKYSRVTDVDLIAYMDQQEERISLLYEFQKQLWQRLLSQQEQLRYMQQQFQTIYSSYSQWLSLNYNYSMMPRNFCSNDSLDLMTKWSDFIEDSSKLKNLLNRMRNW